MAFKEIEAANIKRSVIVNHSKDGFYQLLRLIDYILL